MENEKKTEPTKIQNQMTAIVVKTLTRNATDSSKDFLEKLGSKADLKENNVVMSMAFNALVEITKQLIEIEGTLNQATGIMRVLLTEEELIELDEKIKETED